MAVAIWDHEPTADDLLRTRLRAGWIPKASELRAGNQILGHAACLFPPKAH
jgi:hypothetical protein